MSYMLPTLDTTHSGALHLDVLGNISLALPYGVKASKDGYSKNAVITASFSGPSETTETGQNITADDAVYETYDNVTGVQLGSSLVTIGPAEITYLFYDSPCIVSMRIYLKESDQYVTVGYGKKESDSVQWLNRFRLNVKSVFHSGASGWHMITFQYVSDLYGQPSVFADGKYIQENSYELETQQNIDVESGIRVNFTNNNDTTHILHICYSDVLCDFRFYSKCLDFAELHSLYVYSLREYTSEGQDDAEPDWEKSLVPDFETLGEPAVYASFETGGEYAEGGDFIQYRGGVVPGLEINHKKCSKFNGMGCAIIPSENLMDSRSSGTFVVQVYLDPDLQISPGRKYALTFGYTNSYTNAVLDSNYGYSLCLGINKDMHFSVCQVRTGVTSSSVTELADTYIPASYRGWLWLAICFDSVIRLAVNCSFVQDRRGIDYQDLRNFPKYLSIGGLWDSNRNLCENQWIGYIRHVYYFKNNYINANINNDGALYAWRSMWERPKWANPVNTCSTVFFLHRSTFDYAAGNTTPVPVVTYGNPALEGDYLTFDSEGSYLYIPAYLLPGDVLRNSKNWTVDLIINIPDASKVLNGKSCLFGNNGYTSDYYAQQDRWCLVYDKDTGGILIDGTYGSDITDLPVIPEGEDVLITVDCVYSSYNYYTVYINGTPVLVHYRGSTVSGSYPSWNGNPRETANYIGWDGGTADSFPAGIRFKMLRIRPEHTHNDTAFSPDELLSYAKDPYT